jgi:hypothetical protein
MGDYIPSFNKTPIYYFDIIDPNTSTRTTCYVAPKTCRSYSLRVIHNGSLRLAVSLARVAKARFDVSVGLQLDYLDNTGASSGFSTSFNALPFLLTFYMSKDIVHIEHR